MSATRLRTVKLLSEITDDYFYLEDLIDKLGMNQATESKALRNAREQVRISSITGKFSLLFFKMHQIPTRLRRPSDFSRTAPNSGCSTPQDRRRMLCPNRAVDKPGKHSIFFFYEALTDLCHSGL